MAIGQTPSATPILDETRTARQRRAWLVVAALFAFMALSYADKVVVGLAGVDLLRDLHMDAAQFGVVQSGFFWLFALGAILTGLLVGRIPARWLLGGVALLWAASLLPMVWSTSFTVLLLTRMLLGFAEGPTAALAFGVTHSWFPAERRAVPTALVSAGVTAGPLLAGPVITAVIGTWSWHAAFAMMAAAGLVWVVLWLLIGREGPEPAGHPKPLTAAALPARVPYARLLTSRTVIGIAVLFFATYCSAAINVSWLPLTLRQGLGYDAATAGWLVTLPYLAGALLMVVFGSVSQALTKRGRSNRVARGLLSCGLVGAGGLATVAWPTLTPGAAQIAMLTLGSGLVAGAQGAAWSLVSDVVPARQRSATIGVLVAFYSMGGVLAPLVLGDLVNGASTPLAGYRLGYTVLGIVLATGAALAGWLINPERDTARFAAHAREAAPLTGTAAPLS
ncbi:MFS transporter [Streptomyces sp. NPDC058067]|uniref:MFS transporter n=1 Tax=Streptomyces sp. NPDC058067 TaxID=3346324 RepID=UPI0036EB7B25